MVDDIVFGRVVATDLGQWKVPLQQVRNSYFLHFMNLPNQIAFGASTLQICTISAFSSSWAEVMYPDFPLDFDWIFFREEIIQSFVIMLPDLTEVNSNP